MNYIITQVCNKGCPYCFAHQSRLENISQMSLDQFNSLIDREASNGIKLLGGEPTQHPQFLEFLDCIHSHHKEITLISNFLFNETIREGIIERIQKGYIISFLINSTDLDVRDRMKTFKDNYTPIYSLLYALDREASMSCGITLDPSKDANYDVNYLDFLRSSIPNIERLRISLDFPGDYKNKNENSIVGDLTTGNRILSVVNWCLNNLISPSIDCILFPCLFKNKEELKFLKKFCDKVSFSCGAKSGAPADIFPDETVSYCYPLKEAIKIKFANYNSSQEASEALKVGYRILKSKVTLPKECETCRFRLTGDCEGPCLGFYDLSKVTIPNWV